MNHQELYGNEVSV